MKINETIHGFTVTRAERIVEINATLYDMIHKKSGARLIYLDRADENKTFAIGFKTIPTDDTGVFHIMEHSVLCGSKKFPLKDPFTEMIKGSISTYINAFTGADKTVYPVASKNDKAFRGLVDVYLDAVFNPLALENPFIFMQEGHRYELDENGELSVTGVVYNEMKGDFSSVEVYADYLLNRLSCPGGTYSYDSGGHPDFITDLSFEDFKRAHDKFYHPSNSCLFLDGEVVIDDIFPLIDSYLNEFDARENRIVIDEGGATVTEPLVASYPIEREEDPTDKTRIYLSYNTFPHSESEKNAALSLATEAIADSNNAPLTKRILDTGLCESFSFYPTRSYSTNALNVIFVGVKDGKEYELLAEYEKAVRDVLSEGISNESLSAILGRREFNMRESDFGTYPAGMVYMSSVIEAALFGEKPEEALKYEEKLTFMREKLNTGYYEELLSGIISSPRATLILHPDAELADRKENERGERLKELSTHLTEDEMARIRHTNESFTLWQQTPDSEEALATIPTLTREDLKTEPREVPTEIHSIDGTEVIYHPIHTAGISYLELYFDASDISTDDLPYLRLFVEMMTEWDTEFGTVTDFRNRIKRHLGAFYLTLHPTKRHDEVKLYISLKLSCLDKDKESALELVDEYLYHTLFNNSEILKKSVKQFYTASVDAIISRGETFAMIRDGAKHSSFEALSETLLGYSYHAFLKDLSERIEKTVDEVIERFEKIRQTYLCRERLTIGITEQDGLEFARRIVGTLRTGGTPAGRCEISPLESINEGIATPASVSYAARMGNLNEIGENLYTGAFALLSSITSLELLWNEIRLKNGAYDTGFSVKPNSGSVGSYSYRDPSPDLSVDYFGRIKEEIDAFLDGEPNLLKYVIGVIGSADTVTTPRNDGANATGRYLAGKTHADAVRVRNECLDADLDDLRRLSDLIGKVMEKSTFTVVGPREKLEKIEGIEKILDI